MPVVQWGAFSAVLAQLAVTAALGLTMSLRAVGVAIGLGCGLATSLLLARGMANHGAGGLGPADRVTLMRATLVGGVATLVADSFARPVPTTMLMSLTVPALVLDAVDGWVARRTETVSSLGARFDGEVDAFLILVLSVYVARSSGAWVLAIGMARYVFLVAGWLVPWMRGALPPRYWRKVVAAVQGVVLAVAAAGVLPSWLSALALVAALAMLTESFGRDVWWLRAAHDSTHGAGECLQQVGAA